MKVATLIQALDLVGRIYRNKNGSQPADAVRKILQELHGAADMTLAEWAEMKKTGLKRDAQRATKARNEEEQISLALTMLERAETQASLRTSVAGLKLSAGEWQALAKRLTGRSAKSGMAAREAVESHFSDRLLLKERIEAVKGQFA
jgi:hypothetical protein